MVARVYHHYLVWERCYSKGLEVVRNVGPPQLGPALKPPNTQMEESRYRIGRLSFFRFYLRLHVIWFTTYKLIIQYTIPGEPIRRFFFFWAAPVFWSKTKNFWKTPFWCHMFVLWCCFLCFGVVFLVLFLHLACVMFLVETKHKYRMEVEVYIYMYVYTL